MSNRHRIEKLERDLANLEKRIRWSRNRMVRIERKVDSSSSCQCGWRPEPGAFILCDDIKSGFGRCPRCKRVIELCELKPSESGCEHGEYPGRGRCEFVPYKDKFCRDCGIAIDSYFIGLESL